MNTLVVSIEGTRSYGLGLTCAITAAGFAIECEQLSRKTRRGKGKSDAIDAHLAFLAVLQLDVDRLPVPRADSDREALRMLSARKELTATRTAQVNRLRAVLLGGDDVDRQLARAALTDAALAGLTHRRQRPRQQPGTGLRHAEIRRLALALRESSRTIKANRAQLHTIVNELAPGLTERHGIGPITAAQAIVSFPHSGRCGNDAAFAALAGTSPLQASSVRTTRHRLNRGGDRALNRAIHTIAHTRMRSCLTQAYVARRTAEGKTTPRSAAASSATSPASSTAPDRHHGTQPGLTPHHATKILTGEHLATHRSVCERSQEDHAMAALHLYATPLTKACRTPLWWMPLSTRPSTLGAPFRPPTGKPAPSPASRRLPRHRRTHHGSPHAATGQ
jgi:transposase